MLQVAPELLTVVYYSGTSFAALTVVSNVIGLCIQSFCGVSERLKFQKTLTSRKKKNSVWAQDNHSDTYPYQHQSGLELLYGCVCMVATAVARGLTDTTATQKLL